VCDYASYILKIWTFYIDKYMYVVIHNEIWWMWCVVMWYVQDDWTMNGIWIAWISKCNRFLVDNLGPLDIGKILSKFQ
jgi:hypothetical protein